MASGIALPKNNLNMFHDCFLNCDVARIVDSYLTLYQRAAMGKENRRAQASYHEEIKRIGICFDIYFADKSRGIPDFPLRLIKKMQDRDFESKDPSRVLGRIENTLSLLRKLHPSSFQPTATPENEDDLKNTLDKIYETHRMEKKEPLYLSLFHQIKLSNYRSATPPDLKSVEAFLNEPKNLSEGVISNFRSRILDPVRILPKLNDQVHGFPLEIVKSEKLRSDDLFIMLKIALAKTQYDSIEAILKHPNFIAASKSQPEKFEEAFLEFVQTIVKSKHYFVLDPILKNPELSRLALKECVEAFSSAVKHNRVDVAEMFFDYPAFLTRFNLGDWVSILSQATHPQMLAFFKSQLPHFANWARDTRVVLVERLMAHPQIVELLLKSSAFVRDFKTADYSQIAWSALNDDASAPALIFLLKLNPILFNTFRRFNVMIAYMAKNGDEEFFKQHFLGHTCMMIHSPESHLIVRSAVANINPGPLFLLIETFGDGGSIFFNPIGISAPPRLEKLFEEAAQEGNIQILKRMVETPDIIKMISNFSFKRAIESASKNSDRSCYLYLLRAAEHKPTQVAGPLGDEVIKALQKKDSAKLHQIFGNKSTVKLIPDRTLIHFALRVFKDVECSVLLHKYGKSLFEGRIPSLKALEPTNMELQDTLDRIAKFIAEQK